MTSASMLPLASACFCVLRRAPLLLALRRLRRRLRCRRPPRRLPGVLARVLRLHLLALRELAEEPLVQVGGRFVDEVRRVHERTLVRAVVAGEDVLRLRLRYEGRLDIELVGRFMLRKLTV